MHLSATSVVNDVVHELRDVLISSLIFALDNICMYVSVTGLDRNEIEGKSGK